MRVSIENPPYEDFIARDDRWETLFHVDPPDWDCEGYYGRELFARDDFTRLETLFAGLRGRFILSRNNVPELRRLFARFTIEAVETTYYAAPGANILNTGELLISGP